MKYLTFRKSLSFSLVVLFLISCSNQKPDVDIKAQINSLTNKEYGNVGTKGIKNPKKEDFKKFVLVVEIKNKENFSDYQILLPDLKNAINSVGGDRYFFGSEKNDNGKSSKEFVFLSRGLNKNDLKKIFENKLVKVKWVTKEKEHQEKTIDISKVLKFN
jgi:hypothetical protein